MKPLLILTFAFVALVLVSCEKCTDCSCTGNNTFEFADSMPEADRDILINSYTQDYQDKSNEVCAKRSDFDSEVADYEAQSKDFTENSTYNGNAWSLDASYDCVCEE